MALYDIPIAHRGLHGNGIPENSMAAFQNAVEHGYNIELDVRILKDGNVAISHDLNMKRMTGANKKVRYLTTDDLKQDKYRLPNGESLPLFSDVLDLVNGKSHIVCELKHPPWMKNCRLEEKVYKMIKGKPWVVIESFVPLSVGWFKDNAPEVTRGILSSVPQVWYLKLITKLVDRDKALRKIVPNFLAFDINCLPNEQVVKVLKDFNLDLLVWTVNSTEKMKRALDVGAKNIIFEDIIPDLFINRT
ncbi:MAG: hypothetical protein LBF68_00820 [Christensenellaceae bacterium]|jgi:glycerophosphoryl diester phosphodiesterase|nr:hypothetical protein [Christensenellaceae bacterium]